MSLNPANIIYLLQEKFDNFECDEIRAAERKLADELAEIIIEHMRLYRGNKGYEDSSTSESYKISLPSESSKLESAGETTTFSFADKKLTLDTTENGGIIAETIENFEKLETFEFRGNTLGVDASIPIADALQSKPRLKLGRERNEKEQTTRPEVEQSVIDGLLRERQDKLDADRVAKELWMKSEEALKEFAKNYSINESVLKNDIKIDALVRHIARSLSDSMQKRQFLTYWSTVQCMRENEYKNWYTKKDVEMRTGIVDDWINELRDIHKCSTYKNHITQNGALFI